MSESPTATCASCRGVCVMVCRSVCQKEADDRGATRVLPFFLQQWTKPCLVFFLPVVIISLFFTFVRSVLSTSVSFSILFLSRSVFMFVLYRCPLALLVSPFFFTYFFLSFLPSLCLPLLFNSLLIFNFPVPFIFFNSYFTVLPSMSAISSLEYNRP